MKKFPSPHGDKFQHSGRVVEIRLYSFRPLTGINFNELYKNLLATHSGFRPLTGINFNASRDWRMLQKLRFRPLTGINFNCRYL